MSPETCSGENKVYTRKNLTKLPFQGIKESTAVLECKVTKFLEYEGDHVILVGEVIYAQAEASLEEIAPLLHESGEKFRRIGEEMTLKREK
jgi:flavin reductase (DIM6/NTAB) family NADH-FMN oxidoreductase RutF